MTDNANDRICETCDYCVYLGEGDFACDERGWCEDWELDTRHAETWILANYCPHCGRRVTA